LRGTRRVESRERGLGRGGEGSRGTEKGSGEGSGKGTAWCRVREEAEEMVSRVQEGLRKRWERVRERSRRGVRKGVGRAEGT